MARAPLLQLSDISLTFGGDPLFDQLNLVVHPGDRLALVGRNGSGKSTLMKVMAGLIEPDKGAVTTSPGIVARYMQQDPDMSAHATLGDFAISELGPAEIYKIEAIASGLKFDPDGDPNTASGGERRRAALAKLVAEDPALLLLDEPTNHLDIQAILWLEEHLRNSRTSFVVISHDRTFLRNMTKGTLWLDRGQMRRQDRGFDWFEEWRDKVWEEEDIARHKLNRKIKAEAKWAVEGISARRKRNQGRVRALKGLRQERANQIKRQGAAALELAEGPTSGKRVITARGISKRFGTTEILKKFTIEIARGDRIAFVGPNGVGKTTLVKMLIGQEPCDSGTVKLGTNVSLAVLDQNRAALVGDQTLWQNLTSDPEIGISGKADQVMVRGEPRNVISYLKEFLFDEAQARAPVRSLSGGEKARLLLARIMARESNLLVLDEPTNDLDVETLDLLQEVLDDYAGTVLLVSHDRDFVDRVASVTVALEGDATATIYAGGWTDYQSQKKPSVEAEAPKAEKAKKAQPKAKPAERKGLSFTQEHRLQALPAEIERLEAEIARLTDYLSDPELYETSPLKFAKATEALTERQSLLAKSEEEWLTLEELREA